MNDEKRKPTNGRKKPSVLPCTLCVIEKSERERVITATTRTATLFTAGLMVGLNMDDEAILLSAVLKSFCTSHRDHIAGIAPESLLALERTIIDYTPADLAKDVIQ